MIQISIYSHGEKLPLLNSGNFFHSPDFFYIAERVVGMTPYMAVAATEHGKEMGHLLAIVYHRCSPLPPFFYTQARIYGEGTYASELSSNEKEDVFGKLLHQIMQRLRHKLCLMVELSDLSTKMFGYRHFRHEGFFPIHWQEIHNSLHSMAPEKRISPHLAQQIKRAYKAGIETREVSNMEEVTSFYRLLRSHFRIKLRHIPPQLQLFKELYNIGRARFFITLYQGRQIGGCVCVYSEGNAYLWYLASQRKRYAYLHPNTVTVWQAIKYAYRHNYAHMCFMDVGLPWKQNPFRHFILKFGGKPIGKYRWFRVNIGWVNRLFSWLYRE